MTLQPPPLANAQRNPIIIRETGVNPLCTIAAIKVQPADTVIATRLRL